MKYKLTEAKIARFWERVDRASGPDACWIWQGARVASGHGMTDIGPAHRIAYTIAKGEITEGLVIMHLCHNPPCCNPSHLQEGTYSENVRAMLARGRKPKSR